MGHRVFRWDEFVEGGSIIKGSPLWQTNLIVIIVALKLAILIHHNLN
jgi:hypothetical protein